ncbi:RNA polymerase sigma-70 factor (ECF subfamily) [Herbihabitans rhizosphaerae]|uniref:RNA polymerase sigma-70 factor (ECF subfamily) n=1 Tax=Herbihabitans rhizosphaerae TaxID=1872711 RepID=A0A4Q7KJA5_9PSEU|nr:RNA polymerase sigma factor [Herbihabitans rhizosphaerae]RZS34684.1 RNA polymerase sigma-70 factor (ECF subfamily) [Herbihabitans rhizosphaerae]
MKRKQAPDRTALEAFERIYRDHVTDVTRYFARRCVDPHLVADLTSDTFVRAITSFATFDASKGSAKSWLIGIARRSFAAHLEAANRGSELARRAGGRRELDGDQLDELIQRIDAERPGRALLAGLAELSDVDREAVELVDLSGLEPREAAALLGLRTGAMRTRLSRARGRLRRAAKENPVTPTQEAYAHE